MTIAMPQSGEGQGFIAALTSGLASKVRHDWEASAFEQAFQARHHDDSPAASSPRRQSTQASSRSGPAASGSDDSSASSELARRVSETASRSPDTATDSWVNPAPLSVVRSGAAWPAGVTPLQALGATAEEGVAPPSSSPAMRGEPVQPIRIATFNGTDGLRVIIGADSANIESISSFLAAIRRECAWSGVTLASLKLNGQSLDLNSISNGQVGHANVTASGTVLPVAANTGDHHGS